MSTSVVPPSRVKLGPFEIEHPFILAPMAGITNSPYRRLMRKLKSSVVVSELVSANGIEHANNRTIDLLRFNEDERVVGLQIFGEHTENLVHACKVIEKLGADFVDLNLGCPVPKVVKKGAGSAMCRDPRALGRTLTEMVRAVKIPVTIKIRTGWDSESRNAMDVVHAATDAGVAWVAIHGRTRAQGYSGDADWNFIGEIKSRARIPIIGNGDLSTPELAYERWKTFGVDAVLIGRGALRNPWIFEQSLALMSGQSYAMPTLERFMGVLELQKQLLEDHYARASVDPTAVRALVAGQDLEDAGDESGESAETSDVVLPKFKPLTDAERDARRARMTMLQARKFLAWYSSGYPGCHEFRSKLFSMSDPDVLWDEARRFFERSIAQRDFKFMSQPFLMGGHG